MPDGPPELSVLIPIKDEADSLAQLTDEVAAAMAGAELGGRPLGAWELILIDDGSTDDTWARIQKLEADHPQLRGLRLRRNFGKSAALAAGLAASHGRYVATLDGDLQDDPAELPTMLAQVSDPDDTTDLVAGHKVDRKDPLTKRLPSKLFNAVTSLVTGLRLRDHNCGLKVARREVFEAVPLYGEMHRFFASIAHAQGFNVVEQSVNHRPRQHGRSKFGVERYVRGGLDLLTVITLTRYRRRPAHLFGGIGIASGVIGTMILAYLTGVWFLTDEPIGTRPLLLAGVLLVLLSVQLISLGLIAELLVSREVAQEDPLQRVRDRVGGPPDAGSGPPQPSPGSGRDGRSRHDHE